MEDRELPIEDILSVPFIFWTCPVCEVPDVRWVNGGLWAICVECGRESRTQIDVVLVGQTECELRNGLVARVGAAVIQVPMPFKKELFCE
jgi:ribosomal protein L37AE/L43A